MRYICILYENTYFQSHSCLLNINYIKPLSRDDSYRNVLINVVTFKLWASSFMTHPQEPGLTRLAYLTPSPASTFSTAPPPCRPTVMSWTLVKSSEVRNVIKFSVVYSSEWSSILKSAE